MIVTQITKKMLKRLFNSVQPHILRWTLQTAGYDVLILTETHGVPPSFDLLQREFPNRIISSNPCNNTGSAAGIVIVMSKQAAKLVIASGTEDPRMAWVRLKGIYNLTVVECYVNLLVQKCGNITWGSKIQNEQTR